MKPRVAAGIDIGGTKSLVGVVDVAGRVLAHRRIETPQRDPGAVAALLAEVLTASLRDAGVSRDDLSGLGVGAPGPLDPKTGVLFEPPNLEGWHRNIPIADLVERATGLRVFLENDANAAALGEAWVGAGIGVQDMIYITVSTGIGGGLILGGALYHGVTGTAGEIGHMTIDPDGPVCSCGRYGHLEALASGPAIARMAAEALRAGRSSVLAAMGDPGDLTAEMVAEAARDGDAVARELYAGAGRALGIAIGSLANLLNPAMVVIGGGVSKAWDLLIEPLWQEVRARAFEQPAAAVRIVPAALGDDVGLIGAAAVVFSRLGIWNET